MTQRTQLFKEVLEKRKKSKRGRGEYIKNYNTLEIIILVIFISRKIEKTLSYITFFFLQKLRTNKATSKLIAKDNFKFD